MIARFISYIFTKSLYLVAKVIVFVIYSITFLPTESEDEPHDQEQEPESTEMDTDTQSQGAVGDSLKRKVESLQGEELGMLKVLYQACEEGELVTVQLLLRMKGNNIDLSTAKFSEGGLTPLHVASKNGRREMVKFILNKGASPMVADEARNTPLHLAATHGHLEVAMDLLVHESQHNEEACESARSNLLQMINATGLSPFGCAIKAPEPHFQIAKEFLSVVYGNPANAIPDFSKSQLFPKFATVPLDKPANIFIVGDPEAGKSTLVKSLQEGKSAFSRLLIGLIASRRVRDVDVHFSGVITTDFSNANFRRVLFHDLAGHTNYFHESLLEPNDSLKHTVFIVVVNLRFNPQKTEERLTYWLNFLHYHTSRLASEGTKPNIVIIGSHKDVKRGGWRSGEKFNEVYTEAVKKRPQLHDCFNRLMKPVSLDCRRFEVSEARQLRSCLQKHCQNSLYQQQEATLPPSVCYILSQVLLDSREFPPFLTLSELKNKITDLAANPGLSLYKLLPTEPAKLMEICKTLCEYGRLLILDNPVSSSDLYSWIVHDIHALLTEIDRRLAILRKTLSGSNEDVENAENVPQQEVGQSHFGIITREKLESVFSSSPVLSRKGSTPLAVKVGEFPSSVSSLNLNSNLAIKLLLKYKYCEAIRSSDPASSNESFFFPGLLQEEEMGEPYPWEPGTNYSFAWCVVPCGQEDKVIEFFLPRFLKKLLLCFIQNYIIHHDDQDLDANISTSYETTAVWSRGVSWSTRDDIKVNIELKDSAIILSMYSQEGKELSCLQLRNKILATIKEEKKKWQPDIETNEFIIPFKGSFPVQTLDNRQMISPKSIEEAILKGEEKIEDSDLQSLLFFEPCIVLSRLEKPIRDQIQDPDHTLSSESISDIFDEFGDDFVQHFNLPDTRTVTTPQPHDSSGQSITTDSEDGSGAPVSLTDPLTGSSRHSSLAESSAATDELSISSEKLLEYMNSTSIFDTAEFLHKLDVSGVCVCVILVLLC